MESRISRMEGCSDSWFNGGIGESPSKVRSIDMLVLSYLKIPSEIQRLDPYSAASLKSRTVGSRLRFRMRSIDESRTRRFEVGDA